MRKHNGSMLDIRTMNKISAKVVSGLVMAVQILVAIVGGAICFGNAAMAQAGHLSRTPVFGIGVSPTSMQSGNMPQAALTVYYNKKFIKNLKANLPALRLCTRDEMPEHNGQTYRDFMYVPLGGNTTEQTEGTVGSGITISTNYTNYTMGQWADYVNFSDFVLATTIDPALESVERELAYRLGETVQDLVIAQFQYLRTLDTKTATYDATASPYAFTKSMLEQNTASLLGQNVRPIEDRKYFGMIHPFFIGDLQIDNTNNSIVDIMKHTAEGMMKLQELPGVDGEEVDVIDLFGARWMTSTMVGSVANWQSSGETALYTYLAGEDAIKAVKLGRPDRTDIGDGDYRNMKLWRGMYERGSAVDPAGVIGGGTSYNTIMSFGPVPDVTSRARVWAAVPQTT